MADKEFLEKIQTLLFMLGISTSLVIQLKHYFPIDSQGEKTCEWLLKAIDCVVYKNESMPPLP